MFENYVHTFQHKILQPHLYVETVNCTKQDCDGKSKHGQKELNKFSVRSMEKYLPALLRIHDIQTDEHEGS